jgi:signal transduction histidine kinase
MLAFVLLGLLPCVVLTWLSFSRTRQAMESQIASGLNSQAVTLQADIDRLMFERLQDAVAWSRSPLMQDLRLGDVDKRVSVYLAGLVTGYEGMYQHIDCVRADGLVLASSRSDRIGRRLPASSAASVALDSRLADAQVRVVLPTPTPFGTWLPLEVRTTIDSAYERLGPGADAGSGAGGKAAPIGELRLVLDTRQISHLLDRAAGADERMILIVDGAGHWVAASRALRGWPLPDAAGQRRDLALAQTGGQAATVEAGLPWLQRPAIVGLGRSQATDAYGGSGWTTLVMVPLDRALAPVQAMAAIFAALLALVLLAILIVAPLIAAAVASPISALTATTRRYQRDRVLPASMGPPSRIAEVRELGQAYMQMMRDLDRSRQELVRAAKLTMMGELGAVLAHEVRTPLGIMRSSAQLLLRDSKLGPEGRELMGFIESETERLNRLVATMLDTARPRRPRFSRCDLHALLTRCAQMLELSDAQAALRPRPRLRLELLAADPWLDADAEQLMQAVFNLLHNAVQAAGAQGEVCLRSLDEDAGLLVECADSGPGVAPEVAQRIFDPFFSRRDGGFGLGLAVVAQVAATHGGRVEVGPGALGGAAFRLHLPRRHPSAEGAGSDDSPDTAA